MINKRDEKYLKKFGKHIRTLRLESGMTQQELTKQGKFGKNQIGLLEAGKINVTLSTIKLLADCFSMTPAELLDF